MDAASNANEANPTREEAIKLLADCMPLAERLSADGLNLIMTETEQTALNGFKLVWLAGYLDGSSHIFRQAGLSRTDLAALHRLLGRSQDIHMRQQHQEGNN